MVKNSSAKSILRVATFNVNSVRSHLPVLERWLSMLEKAGTPVDLLFLQETKAVDADFPTAAFEAMGYRARFCGEKSYNGVAVISRVSSPFSEPEVRFGFGDREEPDFPTRVAYAKTSKIAILNTYVPQGKEITHADYALKKRFLERVRAFFDREITLDLPFAWVGDLNVAPTDIDVTHPENKRDHVCFHREIREKFQWVVSWGLSDILRRFHPEEGEYTFFDYRVKDAVTRNVGWRIDHILANDVLTKKAWACFVDREPRTWEKPSDHTPLVADFEI
ncbi:MAG: exodeoxyribonuclease III [Synergistaceae bacterium]|jgi:exodeoxyribonuclease-3|nr:exodeoxyribonuclease III [Synergistaceae bacterium]